jgi:hypothetical protein
MNHTIYIQSLTYIEQWETNNKIILEDFTNLEAEFDIREVPTPTKTPKLHTIRVWSPHFICRYCEGKPMHTR